MTDTLTTSQVTIIGAGPSGLLLARYLQIHDIPVVIYEREASRNARTQGGSLDLHPGTGLKALEETGLMDLAEEKLHSEAEVLKIMDCKKKVWYDENDYEALFNKSPDYVPKRQAMKGRPEIDR